MLEALILGLCIILIYSTAQPVLWIRYSLVDLFINRDSCPPRQLWLSRLLECLSCSSFWIGIGVWFLIPYVPLFLQYAIYLYAIVTSIEIIKNNYLGHGLHRR